MIKPEHLMSKKKKSRSTFLSCAYRKKGRRGIKCRHC
ncbi:unnamed protein product, partial [Brassica oleracea]